MSLDLDRQAFLRAIIAEPDDDAPRLVFADWLDENGEPERAEFIRLQCARGRDGDPSERERELLNTNASKWAAEIRYNSKVRIENFQRGFLSEARFENFKAFREHAARVLSATPVDGVRFGDLTPRTVLNLAAMPELAHVRGLRVDGREVGTPGLSTLLCSPHLCGLRSLDINGGELLPEAVTAIARFSALRRLTLHFCSVGDAGLQTFAEHANLPRLEKVSIWQASVADAGVVALAECSRLPALRDLELYGGKITDIGAIALASSPHFPQLKFLNCDSNRVNTAGARALLGRPGLRKLNLQRNQIGVNPPEVSAEVPAIREPGEPLDLSLTGNRIDDATLTALADWPGLESVTSLSLVGNAFGGDGLRALAASPRLRRLTSISLIDNQVHPHGLEALLLSPHARVLESILAPVVNVAGPARKPTTGPPVPVEDRRVRVWFAGQNHLSESAAAWLADSVCLGRIDRLEMEKVPTGAVPAALVRSSHLANLQELIVTTLASGSVWAKAIAEATHLVNLRQLRIGSDIGERAIRLLADAKHLASVKHLDLRGNNVKRGAIVLVEAPHFADLELLELRNNPIDDAVAASLRAYFGERVVLPVTGAQGS